MKVFRTTHYFAKNPKTGLNTQCAAVVAASSKKAAAKAFGMSVYTLTQYGSITGNEEEIKLAMMEPGEVFISEYYR